MNEDLKAIMDIIERVIRDYVDHDQVKTVMYAVLDHIQKELGGQNLYISKKGKAWKRKTKPKKYSAEKINQLHVGQFLALSDRLSGGEITLDDNHKRLIIEAAIKLMNQLQ